LHHTQFTVSVDLIGQGCTTGISAHDRSKTIQALVNPATLPHELGRPGHIFPLRAKKGGVLRRTGHTEAAVDFARLAGLSPSGILVEILNDDGSMARLPQLVEVAKRFGLKLVSIEDLVAYRMRHDSLIRKEECFDIKTRFGAYRMHVYRQTTNDQIHMALTLGSWKTGDPILTRINSTLSNNDLLGTLTGDSDKKLEDMFNAIQNESRGAIIFINQPVASLNSLSRIRGLKENQQRGIMKVPDIDMDNKDFGIGAQIMHDLDIQKIKLLTNSEQGKRVGLVGYGLEIVGYQAY
ncbi:3,4-dihydroxy-2-butanone-4-phosphate synthase, partial [Robiginitalea sp.]|nr:3,4-dihydroxy-2-butanone-4-phosphate synthase [Robiginitalea sp.]